MTDEEILQAQQVVAQQMGLLVEPAAAAAVAGYLKWEKEGHCQKQDRPLALLTGSGLKDVQALQRWNQRPKALSPEEWRNRFQQS